MAGDLFLGLISGTSADGIDAALVRFQPRTAVVAAQTFPWPAPLRRALLALAQEPDAALSPDAFGQLDAEAGEAFAAAALSLLQQAGVGREAVAGIGSHGQTIRHRPDGDFPFSLQLGDPARIAERTGITTVADFRRRDVAAGGQGAPLMPAFHAALFGGATRDRAVLNLGGIANLTLLPGDGAAVRGFDTGPANALLDGWCEATTGQPFDREGALAAAGEVDESLLARLLAEPWFARPAPKSTGREVFHGRWLDARLGECRAAADVQATLVELTAATVAAALLRELPGCTELLVCGGGVHNPVLMRRLAARLPQLAVASTASAGLDPDHVEACGFAWLAAQTLAGLPGNLPSVTGARGPRILGAIHPA